jgi:hypothetical protein
MAGLRAVYFSDDPKSWAGATVKYFTVDVSGSEGVFS